MEFEMSIILMWSSYCFWKKLIFWMVSENKQLTNACLHMRELNNPFIASTQSQKFLSYFHWVPFREPFFGETLTQVHQVAVTID